ncbi:hypothetical protein [Actinoallomurus sp. CA-150999]|uniref:hypothetical protein n=1 Tax=Actinoallomurus sp. CA-150999 TaxID=3239887 RepID=UPI003D8D5501
MMPPTHADAVTAGAGASAKRPTPLRWLSALLVLQVVLLVTLTVLMIAAPGITRDAVLRGDPTLSRHELDIAVKVTIAYVAAMHVVHLAIATWLVVKALKRRRWARNVLTIYLPLATVGSLVSWSDRNFAWVVILSNVVNVAIVGLLWLPRSVRAHFASTI